MKIVLTESQFNALQEIEGAAQILEESLNVSKKIEDLKKTVKRLLYAGIAVSAIITAINKQDISQTDKDVLIQTAMETSVDSGVENREFENIFNKKVDACREYMKYALTNQGYTLESTGLNPETLVRASMENGFDLPFMMAAAHQESCFGATPRAKRTNSVFSEGSYDNGRNAVIYNDPNESVYGYIKLLKRSYLVDGKTLLDLLEPGKFVNGVGNRYASDKRYEQKIKMLRNRIISMYPELL